MGNTATNPDLEQLGMLPNTHENASSFHPKHHFIIHFNSVSNIPASEHTTECRPYIRSFIGIPTELENGEFIISKLSSIVSTPIKADHADKSGIWQSYRDFYIQPPSDSFVVIEIVNAKHEGGDSDILGTVFAPVIDFVDEKMRTYTITSKNRNSRPDVKFTISLRRVYINTPPPSQKTIFLVRHGESKWNKAQAKRNIGGLLDRDHALTEQGVIQAMDLNQRWKTVVKTVNLSSNALTDWGLYSVPQTEKVDDDDTNEHEDEVDDEEDECLVPNTNILLDLDFEDPEPLPIQLSPQSRPKDLSSLPIDDLHMPGPAINSARSNSPAPRLSSSAQSSTRNQSSTRTHKEIHISEEMKHVITPQRSPDSVPSSSSTSAANSSNQLLDFDNIDQQPSKPVAVDEEFLHDYGLDTQPQHFDSSNNKSHAKDQAHTDSMTTGEVKRASSRFNTSEEAIAARREEYIRKFLHADAIYSSPLTRAIETAFIVMDGHPAADRGLTLYSHIREVKKLGGLDSVGMVYGNAIEERVKDELTQVIGRHRTEEVMIESLHYNDCNSPWWTSISSYESQAEQQDRVREFISFARYSEHIHPVFVGHSLFFKAFYSKRVSNMLKQNRPDMADNMRKHRLSNATLMACTLKFIDRPTGCDAIILDADLVFGGGFHGVDSKQDDEDMIGNSALSVSPQGSTITSAIMLERLGSFRSKSATAVGNVAESISNRLSHTNRRETIREIKSEVKSIAQKLMNGLK